MLLSRTSKRQRNSMVSLRMCSIKWTNLGLLLDRSAPFMNDIVISKGRVIKLLKGLNPSKALGPDELHPSPKGASNRVRSGICSSFPAINGLWWNPKGIISCKYLTLFQEEWQITCMQLSPGFLDLCTLQVTRTHSMFKYHQIWFILI